MTVEIRYFRSDTEVVNAVTYYKLLTSQTGTLGNITSKQYVKFKVYRYQADGTKTLIGTTGAIDTGSLDGMYSVNWNCPETSLASTDRIMVEVTASATLIGTYSVIASFITEQIGATLLDAATWTFYYYGHYYETVTGRHLADCEYVEIVVPHWAFYFDTDVYNSRITNFTWSVVAVVIASKRLLVGVGL